MAARRPLVNVNGTLQEMPSGDVLTTDTYSASGATQGRATIDFGAFPGSVYTSLTITGLSTITATSYIDVFIDPAVPTADHTSAEHFVDPPRVAAGDIVVGVGFTIHAFSVDNNMHHGQYTVSYQIT
jgi:hypothetical protein